MAGGRSLGILQKSAVQVTWVETGPTEQKIKPQPKHQNVGRNPTRQPIKAAGRAATLNEHPETRTIVPEDRDAHVTSRRTGHVPHQITEGASFKERDMFRETPGPPEDKLPGAELGRRK